MSDLTNATQAFLTNYQDKLNAVGPRAVGINLALMIAVSFLAIAGFSLLRPSNSTVYQPKFKYAADGKAPPKINRGFLDWVKPLATTNEDILMQTIGLDAVCFLRFLKMCRNLFVSVSIIAMAVLFPIDIIYNVRYVTSSNIFSMLTIQAISGNWLYGHVVVAYVITLIVFYFIWTNYAEMVRLRWQYFRSDEYQGSLHARSLLITSIHKSSQSDEGLADLLRSLNIPYPTTAVHIGRQVGQLPDLLEQHNNAVRALEVVLTRYLKVGGNNNSKRPTIKVNGKKVDAIDHLTTKIQGLDDQIKSTRENITAEKAENYGFASFASVPFAHIVGKTLEHKRKGGSHFMLAPAPADIIWKNLTMTDAKRSSSKIMGGFILVLTATLYTIPLLAVAALANLAAFTTFIPWLENISTSQPFWFSAFAGIVPPLLSVFLALLLPMIMRAIALFQGDLTHSQSDRVVTARYSAFLFITQFFIFSVLSVIISLFIKIAAEIGGKESFGTIVANLKTVPRQLQTTWVIQSMYWLTAFPLRGFSALFDLAQVISLLFVWVQTILFGRTPRDIREFSKPPEFDYAVYFANHLLMVVVALVYAPLAPLVPLFAAVAFGVSFIVYKYQLMYVSETRVETGGRLWRVAVNRILMAVGGMQALMLLTMGLQLGWLYAISMAPAILMVIVFKIVLSKKFDSVFRWYIPNDQEMAESRIHRSDQSTHRLESRYGQPCLNEKPFTVLLHKSIQHLLPSVYHGHLHTSKKEGSEKTQIGGLTFSMLEGQDEMAIDRATYLRERNDDNDSITTGAPLYSRSTTMIQGGDEYFESSKSQMLGGGGGGGEEDGESPYELQRIRDPAEYAASTEQLLANTSAAGYNPSSAGNNHYYSRERQFSTSTTNSVNSPLMYQSQQPGYNHRQQQQSQQQQQQPQFQPQPQRQRMEEFDFGFPPSANHHQDSILSDRQRSNSASPSQNRSPQQQQQQSQNSPYRGGNSSPSYRSRDEERQYDTSGRQLSYDQYPAGMGGGRR